VSTKERSNQKKSQKNEKGMESRCGFQSCRGVRRSPHSPSDRSGLNCDKGTTYLCSVAAEVTSLPLYPRVEEFANRTQHDEIIVAVLTGITAKLLMMRLKASPPSGRTGSASVIPERMCAYSRTSLAAGILVARGLADWTIPVDAGSTPLLIRNRLLAPLRTFRESRIRVGANRRASQLSGSKLARWPSSDRSTNAVAPFIPLPHSVPPLTDSFDF
jgi:hypothetical protein